MDERRFADEEIRDILDRAVEAERSAAAEEGLPGTPGPSDVAGAPDRAPEGTPPGKASGLTLAQLQEVGEEVGISPESIARAAAALDHPIAPGPQARILGLPVSVSRTMALPRELSDREWDQLVARLRETFQAKGRVEGHGGIRSWSNGNLLVTVEPDDHGQRLRMQTRKGEAGPTVGMGLVATLMGLVITTGVSLPGGVLILAWGVGALAFTALRLPRWARTRAGQMEDVAAWIRDRTLPARELPGASSPLPLPPDPAADRP